MTENNRQQLLHQKNESGRMKEGCELLKEESGRMKEEIALLKAENERLKEELANMKRLTEKKSFRERYALQILDQIPDMLTVFDKEERVVEVVSNEKTNHVGVGNESLKGVHMSDVLTKEAYEAIRTAFQKVLETGEYAMGYHDIEVDGVMHNYEHHCFPLDDYVLVMCHDITKRISASNRLTALSRLTDTILAHVPVSIFVKDCGDERRYLYWNKAMERMTGKKADEAIGKTDYELWEDSADIECFTKQDEEMLATKTPIKVQHTFIATGKEPHVIQIHKLLVDNGERNPLIVGLGYDISNLEEIEEELVEERIKAEKADRQKSAFLANMSHEIRSPLTAIVGFAELMAYTDESDEREQYARIIGQNSELLMQLIYDILDTAKMEAGTLEYKKTPMDLTELCEGLSQTMLTRVQEGVRLIFDRPNRDVRINEDANRISQVIINLITNATKFTPRGEIHFGYEVQDETIHFHVSDTGIGIPEEKIDKVFDRFVKLNDRAQGTGLGLAICKMIVTSVGGKIWVESEYGKGSTFFFDIPLDECE